MQWGMQEYEHLYNATNTLAISSGQGCYKCKSAKTQKVALLNNYHWRLYAKCQLMTWKCAKVVLACMKYIGRGYSLQH